jgi:bifunctional non-homologous end joining protein LigD
VTPRRSTKPKSALFKITPVRLVERAAPFDDPDYIFELKYDGFRTVPYIEHDTAHLVSRKGITYTRFDDLCAGLLRAAKVRDAVLDGEIVCLDQEGKPRFDWLLHRRHPAAFVAFDLVWLNGKDYRQIHLLERKAALRKLVRSNSPVVLYADFMIERGLALFRAACDRDLEGIIAKKKDEPYSASVRWVKIKNPAYTQAVGRGEQFQQTRTR